MGKEKTHGIYEVKGYIHKGDGVYNLEYVKEDTKKLLAAMYYKDNLLYLQRKYHKLRNAVEKDQKFGIVSLQKQRKPE